MKLYITIYMYMQTYLTEKLEINKAELCKYI